jgi:hypothetical protein
MGLEGGGLTKTKKRRRKVPSKGNSSPGIHTFASNCCYIQTKAQLVSPFCYMENARESETMEKRNVRKMTFFFAFRFIFVSILVVDLVV